MCSKHILIFSLFHLTIAQWSPWSLWSTCTTSCGNGAQKRSRTCDLQPCPGLDAESRDCTVRECGKDTPCPSNFTRIDNKCFKVLRNGSWDAAWSICTANSAQLIHNIDRQQESSMRKDIGFWTETDDGLKATDAGGLHRRNLTWFSHDRNVLNSMLDERRSYNYALCASELKDKCFTGWSKHGDSECIRLFENRAVTFDTAERDCLVQGGHLASVRSEDDYDIIVQLMEESKFAVGCWLGLRDQADDLYFEWVDYTSASYIAEKVSDWFQINATRDRSRAHCFALVKGAESGDRMKITASNCDDNFAYVCTVKAPEHHEAGQCREDGYDPPWSDHIDIYSPSCAADWQFIRTQEQCSCWRYVDVALTITDARQYCGEMAASVITIRNEDEQLWLTRYLKNISRKAELSYNVFWLGFYRTDGEWLDGEENEMEYSAFDDSRADRNHGEDSVSFDTVASRWQYDWSRNRWPFICRIDVSCLPPTTPRPLPTLNPIETVVAYVMQSLGCMVIVCILASTLIAFLLLRNFSFERMIMMNGEASLLFAHLLLMTTRDNYGDDSICKAVAFALHYFYFVHFVCLLIESIQSYCIVTCVIMRGGIIKIWQLFVVTWVVPLFIVGPTVAIHIDVYITRVMCFLDLTGPAVLVVLTPMICLLVAATVVAEAIGMSEEVYPKIPGHDKNQMAACKVSQRGLAIIIPLSTASWVCGLIAVSQQNLPLFTVNFGINIALSIAILIFHALADQNVRALFNRTYKFIKTICRRKKLETGSFEDNFKHDFIMW